MATTSRTWIEPVTLSPPSLSDNTADADRLLNALKKRFQTNAIQADIELVRLLPEALRQWRYEARCVLFSDGRTTHLIGLTAKNDGRIAAGLAVDLGTTRVVLRLIDLETGRALAESSFENPQTASGDDILTRIHYTDREPDGLSRLHDLIIQGINNAISHLCAASGISSDDIYLLAVAGNTAMAHFFLNLPPRWLIREPYIPVINEPGIVEAAQIGIIANPLARIYVFPNIGSYFGGDLVSGILYSGMARGDKTTMLVDVGTNAEVVLGNKEWLGRPRGN